MTEPNAPEDEESRLPANEADRDGPKHEQGTELLPLKNSEPPAHQPETQGLESVRETIRNLTEPVPVAKKLEQTSVSHPAGILSLKTRMAKALDGIKYPNSHALIDFALKGMVPLVVLEHAAFNLSSIVSEYGTQFLSIDRTIQIYNTTRNIGFTAMYLGFASAGYYLERHLRGQKSFGKFLTVRKAAVTDKVLKDLPELKGQRYYGELHFVGKFLPVRFPKNRQKTTYEGLRGFAMLAESCKKDDPFLRDISVFVGKSDLVDDNFRNMGFKVRDHLKKKQKGPALKLVDKFGRFMSRVLFNMNNPERDSRVAIIDRDIVVQNSTRYEKMAKVSKWLISRTK